MTQSNKTKLAAASLAFLMLVVVFVNSIPPVETNETPVATGPMSSQESFDGIVSEAPEVGVFGAEHGCLNFMNRKHEITAVNQLRQDLGLPVKVKFAIDLKGGAA